MPDPDHRAGMFPALLKHWRRQRGLSQLDLALTADISARHISFLETGRSRPSPEMVVRLAATLGVPLRHVNAMLRAAGHDAVYDESDAPVPTAVLDAIALLKAHHEPFPFLVVDHAYRILDANRGALAVLGAVVLGIPPPDGASGAAAGPGDPLAALAEAAVGMNLARLTFDPAGARPYLVNFDELGRALLWRLQREALADADGEVVELLDDILAMPTVDPAWRDIDLSVPSEPALVLHLRRDELDLRFLTTITAFQAPQNVAVERLRIETWLPFDEPTAAACRRLAGSRPPAT